MAMVSIYTLNCPETNEVKYVGKTLYPKKRLYWHIYESKHKNNKKACWIKSLIKKGMKPKIDIIDTVKESEWSFWEQYYISLYKSWGFSLKNHTIGGEVGGGMSGCKTSELQKSTVSKIMKGNTYAKGNTNTRKAISCIDIKKGIVTYYDSCEQASKELKILRQAINNNLKGLSKIVSKQYYFDYQ